jgi:tubulin beta
MSREIITVQVGSTGNNVGKAFWSEISNEHGIDQGNNATSPPIGKYRCFFDETSAGKFYPRVAVCDLNEQDLSDSLSSGRYKKESVIGSDCGSGNCYAKAFHTEGPEVADKVLNVVRREIEKCNALQGVQLLHSLSGGTGSGLGGLLLGALNDYLDASSNGVGSPIIQSIATVPSPNYTDTVVAYYNTVLAIEDLMEHCHQVFFFDNEKLASLSGGSGGGVKFDDINTSIGKIMSGLTSSMRFPGLLNADLRKMNSNLVPFKNAHFLAASFAPVGEAGTTVGAVELSHQMIDPRNVTLSIDPMQSRTLASFASFRGNFTTGEVTDVLQNLEAKGSQYDRIFPDWIPNCISSSVSGDKRTNSVTYAMNTSAISTVFDRIGVNFDKMIAVKSHIHVYEENGISTTEMAEARNVVTYLKDQYSDYALWEDKLLENRIDNQGFLKINEKAAQTDEQLQILEELRKLQNLYIVAPGRA